MPQVILRKVFVANPTAIRTDTVEGWTSDWPMVGRCFYMQAPPIDPKANIREVVTSKVTEVDGRRFSTESGSVYELELVHE